MKERTEALLIKYYEGKTTLAEEMELRGLLLTTPSFEEEKQFFIGLQGLKAMEPSPRPLPKAGRAVSLWQKVAAVVAVFLSLTWLFVDLQTKKEEALAFAQVMEALDLIQENLHKGTKSLDAMQEIRHLNKTNEMFNINKKEEQ